MANYKVQSMIHTVLDFESLILCPFCGLQSGCRWADGKRRMLAVAVVANLTKPTKCLPSLLETFFREFGHIMHKLCSRVGTLGAHSTLTLDAIITSLVLKIDSVF